MLNARTSRALSWLPTRLRPVVVAFAILYACCTLPVSAQQSGRTWKSSVTGSTVYPTQSSVEAAIRAIPAYAGVTHIKQVTASESQTTYTYWKGLYRPTVYNLYSSGYGNFDTENAALAAWAAAYDQRAQSTGCTQKTSITPYSNWTTSAPEAGRRNYDIYYYLKSGGTCTRFYEANTMSRSKNYRCPSGLTLSSSKLCRDSSTLVYVASTPMVCARCHRVGNPIDVTDGDKYQAETDFDLGWLVWTRYYHSSAYAGGTLGRGWSHSHQTRVTFQGVPSVIEGDGSQVAYRSVGNDYEASDGSGNRLVSSSGWTLYKRNEKLAFDTSGALQRRDFEDGAFLLYAYDDLGRLVSITHSSGRIVRFDYLPGDQADDTPIGSIALDGKTLVTYSYDNGHLATATYPDLGGPRSRRYHYEDARFPDALTGITDESDVRYATYAYDDSGRAIESRHAGDADNVAVVYGAEGAATVKDALEHTTRYNLTSGSDGRPRDIASREDSDGTTSRQVSYTYAPAATDFRRRLTSVVDERLVHTEHTYADATDPVLGVPVSTHTVREAAGTADERVRSTGTVIATNSVVVVTEPGRETRIARNVRLQPTSVTIRDLATQEVRTTTTTYCEQSDVTAGTCPRVGLVARVDGPRTDVDDATKFTYRPADDLACASSPASCAFRKGDLWKVTNAAGHVVEILRYNSAGRPLSVKDANGLITDLEYHPRGWLAALKKRGPDNGSEADDLISRFDYWPGGQIRKVTQPDQTYVVFEYDSAHRLTAISNNVGERIEYRLDGAGNRTREDTRDPQGALRRTLSRIYNELGQLRIEKDAYEYPTSFTYDSTGNGDLALDARSHVTDNDYDALNRIRRTVSDATGIAAESTFKYDGLDRVVEVVDPKRLSTTYGYDGFGGLTRVSSPDTGTTNYTYDSAGNLQTHQDARGASTRATYRYDELNRLTKVSYATGVPNVDVSYRYDEVNSTCQSDERAAIGHLTLMSDASGQTQFCYDRFGRLTRKVQVTNGATLTTAYRYQATGRLQSMTYPSGMRVDYGYDGAGRPSAITVTRAGDAPEVLVSAVTYYPFGPVGRVTYAGTRTLDRQFDKNYRPILIQDVSAGGEHDLLEWDEVGNLASLADSSTTPLSTPLASYRYDGLDRLLGQYAPDDSQQVNPLRAYAYDSTGNRTSSSARQSSSTGAPGQVGGNQLYTTEYAYAPGSHRLMQVGGTPRSYDGAGNTTEVGSAASPGSVVATFSYDAAGRLSRVARGATVMNYTYNGRGEQVRRYPSETSTAQTYFLYDELGHWVGEYDVSGATRQEIIWLDNLPVGLIAPPQVSGMEQVPRSPDPGPGDPMPTPPPTAGTAASTSDASALKLYYIEADHIGSPRVVIDPQRNVAIWRWELTGEAFGNTPPNEDPDGNGERFSFDMRFPGQRYDSASGLNYNYFRDYDPETGRYLESDPAGLSAGASTYAYVGGNPVSRIDPLGLDFLVIGGGIRDGSFNFFGHVGMAITGYGMFSYGNDTPLGSSVTNYLQSQSQFRNQTVTVIPATAAQDAAAAYYLALNHPDKNDVGYFDNCAVRTNEGLMAGGKPSLQSPFPGSLSRAAGTLPGAQTFFIPQGGPIPQGLLNILPSFNRGP